MGLNPMKNQMGIECDNCGVCISACNEAALGYAFGLPLPRPVSAKPCEGNA
jgi:ferredoxin